MSKQAEREARCERANELIVYIAARGRKFMHHKGFVSRFELSGWRVYYIDRHTRARIYAVAPRSRWRGFSGGGTIKSLVEDLARYVRTGKQIDQHFGPWPDWLCGGDPWGYGRQAMAEIRAEAVRLGVMPERQALVDLAGGVG